MTGRRWAGVIVGVAGGALAVRFGLRFPWASTLAALSDSDPLLLAGAALMNLASLAAKGGVWYFMFRRRGNLRTGTAQAATFVGAAVGSLGIAVSGEAARMQVAHERDGVAFSPAAVSLITTRIAEGLGLVAVVVPALLILEPWPGARITALAALGVAVTLTACYHLLPRPRRRSPLARIGSLTGGSWAAPVALGSMNWLAQWTSFHWTMLATHAVVSPAASLTALLAANLAGIPRLTPGNIGVIQGSVLAAGRAFGIPAAQGMAAGLALQAVQVLPVLTIAAVLLGTRGMRQFAARRAWSGG